MYCKSTLANGIRIVSEHIPYVKSVTIGIWIGTGSRSEALHNHGVSHFIEHLMFKGTASRSAKDIAETIDGVGGQLNAFTAKEHTCYYVKVLDTHVALAFDVISDMLLSSKFDEQDLQREREVVLEEVHMYEDSPDELVHDIHLEKIWHGHPLGCNILGTTESIVCLDHLTVRDYYEGFYTPDNIVIAAAGNITHQQLEEQAAKYFSALTGKKRQAGHDKPILEPANTVYHKDVEQVHLCIGTVSVPNHSPEIYTAHILNNILGGGISSRLFQTIREERGLAYSVYSYQNNYSDAGLFTVYAGTRPSHAAEVTELILSNMADLSAKGITEAELYKTKEQLKGGMLLGLESSSSRMSRIGKMEITLGKHYAMEEVVDKIERVTATDVQQMAQRLFDAKTMCFTALGPVDDSFWSMDLNLRRVI